MSLATLKKKTQVQYRNMSVGSKNGGFSLNGTRRSQGYIGRGVLGLHFPSTPMRGNVARGHGGTNGTYYQGPIIQSVCFTSLNGNSANNDFRKVKPSVLDTNGMLMTKYRWIRRPQPYAVVKPDSNMIQFTQNSYIENKSKKLIATLYGCEETGTCKPCNWGSFSSLYGSIPPQRNSPFGTTIRIPRGWSSITKTANIPNVVRLGAISQGEFIKALGGPCQTYNKTFRSNTRNNAFGC
jgi:hypothetical protein